MTGYSALFSAGLLATSYGFPKTPSKDRSSNYSDTLPLPLRDGSPVRPVSPLPGSSDSDVDMDCDSAREATPTQQSVSAAAASTSATTTTKSQPRLRKRRSSLTITTSPMTSIRSPMRTAGAALQLQRHLALASPGSRSRSGSMTQPPSAVEGTFSSVYVPGAGSSMGTEGTSIMGRLRSGSMGSARSPPMASAVPTRIRRHVRRVTSVPAPMPPPTTPLPDVPGFPSTMLRSAPRTPLSFQNSESTNTFFGMGPAVKPSRSTRDRGLSVGSPVGRIDEEMKEN
ncbi:hypothetical protein FA15DRAFT_659229 [Coprinopsis marcescibilis]|uniref:Uncharacterized protein n=1 Tax=Coprinopsis marcescibilis TaxID=230819 RepID=A0A5C3KJ17_COPMA|nr:hypothetical protein FA15DRAFT_659229 [Coprinopsis marcescibilis]